MAIVWADSAAKHGIPRDDVLYAMEHDVGRAPIDENSGKRSLIIVGLPHPQARRYIEVCYTIQPPNQILVFHAMELREINAHLVPDERKIP